MYLKYDLKDIFKKGNITVDYLINSFEIDTYEELITLLYQYTKSRTRDELDEEEKIIYDKIEMIIEQLITNYDINLSLLINRFSEYQKKEKEPKYLTSKTLRLLYQERAKEFIYDSIRIKKLESFLNRLVDYISNVEENNYAFPKYNMFSKYLYSFNYNDKRELKLIHDILKVVSHLNNTKIQELKLSGIENSSASLKKLHHFDKEISIAMGYFRKKYNYLNDLEELIIENDATVRKARELFTNRTFKDNKIKLYVPDSKLLVPKYVDIITIDDEDSFDLDDAVFLEHDKGGNYVLHVFISNVAECLDKNPQIDKEAYKREETIYTRNKIYHMIGDKLATDHLSLVEGQKRATYEHIMTISKLGELISYDVRKAQIHVKKKMSYEGVNEIIQSGLDDTRMNKMIQEMNQLANLLKTKSKRLDDCPEIGKMSKYDTSENIICEFSVLTNLCLAETFYVNGYPFIYRNHQEGNEAFYSNQNLGHYSLNLRSYCHSTSPIRRYPDVINQRLTDSFLVTSNLSDTEYYEIEQRLTYDCQNLNESVKLAKAYYKQGHRIKK